MMFYQMFFKLYFEKYSKKEDKVKFLSFWSLMTPIVKYELNSSFTCAYVLTNKFKNCRHFEIMITFIYSYSRSDQEGRGKCFAQIYLFLFQKNLHKNPCKNDTSMC